LLLEVSAEVEVEVEVEVGVESGVGVGFRAMGVPARGGSGPLHSIDLATELTRARLTRCDLIG
jgi:hypothetical protein